MATMSDKPSTKEEEYFARKTFEWKKKKEEDRHKKMDVEEKKQTKELHYMHCPKCGMKLITIDFNHIKIDKCSGCGGIWLDPGELEIVLKMGEELGEQKGVIGRFLNVFKS